MSSTSTASTSTSPTSSPAVPLSVLDVIRVAGSGAGAVSTAIAESMAATREAERLGYARYWFAEHHNSPGIVSSATAVLIGRAAAETERIRVGSGGIMLPNHAPLTVAESFGTLAQMYPGRIDLGLGRAPGTDPMTARALARSSAEPQEFARHVYDLQGWFSATGRGHSTDIYSVPSAGTEVPVWILGSTEAGASIAAQLGLPFAVASHFAPDQLDRAVSVYREMFRTDAPTARLERPHLMVGVNVMAADDAAEAWRQFSVTQQSFIALRRGRFGDADGGAPEPVSDLTTVASPGEIAMAESMLSVRAVGEPDTVARELAAVVERTGADELVTVTYARDPQVRLRSLELTAQAWGTAA